MRVIIADDHRMMRDGLRAILEKAGIEVAGEASNGHEAIAEAIRLRPDVAIIDITMPALNGIDATRRLTAEVPGMKVLVLSMNADQRYVIATLEAGAAGYVLKNAASEELLIALSAMLRGERYLSPGLRTGVTTTGLRDTRRLDRSLTPREREVLQLLAEGKSSKEIANVLDIALPTVETHRRQLMAKLNLRTIAELTKYAIREGLTSLEQ